MSTWQVRLAGADVGALAKLAMVTAWRMEQLRKGAYVAPFVALVDLDLCGHLTAKRFNFFVRA